MTEESARPRGYDVREVQQRIVEEVRLIVKDVELRKWCVRRVIQILESGAVNANNPGVAAVTGMLFQEIYDFVTPPLTAAVPHGETASPADSGTGPRTG